MWKYSYRLWPDPVGMQICEYMKYMEGKGLRFHSLIYRGLIARFQRVEPAEVQYDWDYFVPKTNHLEREIMSYLNFYEDQGWEIAWQFNKEKVFRAKEGMHPVPIYLGDEEAGLKKEKKLVFRQSGINASLSLVIIATFFILFNLWFAGSFLILPLHQQLSFLWALPVALWAAGSWLRLFFLRFSERHRRGWSVKDSFWGTLRLWSYLSGAAVLIICSWPENIAGVAGACIGMSIGAVYTGNGGGMAGEARRLGMKGIYDFSLWRAALSWVISLAVLIVAFHPSTMQQEYLPWEGSNLNCSVIYREAEPFSWNDSYYAARSSRDADKLMEYFMQRDRDEEWEPVDLADLPQALEPAGPYPVKENLEDAQIYRRIWKDSVTANYRPFLIRCGNEIWYSVRVTS